MKMSMVTEHERLARMLKESITLMCKSSLTYGLELNIEGLLGITLDKKDIFLVNINESFQTQTQKETERTLVERESVVHKRAHSDGTEVKEESRDSPSPSPRKRRPRRRSHDSTEERASYSDIIGDFELPEFSTSQRLGAVNSFGDLPDQDAEASITNSAPHNQDPPRQQTDSSREYLGASVAMHSGTSDGRQGDEAAGQGQLPVDLDGIVIKQEVSDNIEEDDDVTFTGESFEGQMPYPEPLALGVPSGGDVPLSQMPPVFPGPSASADGSQPSGMLASGSNLWSVLPSVALSHQPPPRQRPGQSTTTSPRCAELKCSYPGCLYTSKFGYNMRRHHRLHTGETVTCPHCYKGYYSDGALKIHIQRHHQSNQNKGSLNSSHQPPNKLLL